MFILSFISSSSRQVNQDDSLPVVGPQKRRANGLRALHVARAGHDVLESVGGLSVPRPLRAMSVKPEACSRVRVGIDSTKVLGGDTLKRTSNGRLRGHEG
jgi:hypothetical protein